LAPVFTTITAVKIVGGRSCTFVALAVAKSSHFFVAATLIHIAIIIMEFRPVLVFSTIPSGSTRLMGGVLVFFAADGFEVFSKCK
jgi:hypothetical protein